MKFLIAGLGSIGQRHVRNLRTLCGDKVEILAYRVRKHRIKELEKRYNLKTYFNYEEALNQKPDAVFITNPTALHIKTALTAAKHGCNIFFEKPLSDNLEGVDKFIKIAKGKNLIIFVAYNMRFHPNLKLIKEMLTKNIIGKILYAQAHVGSYLPDWHPREDYRRGYSANKDLGGGVILDMSHEIDYMRWFLGDVTKVFSFSDKISNLELKDVEDVSEILLKFKSGAIGSIHLDYVQKPLTRFCQIVGEKGTIIGNLVEKKVKVFLSDEGVWKEFSEDKYDSNKMYIDELRHFINCLKGREKALVDILDGKRVVEIAMAAKESSKTGGVVKIKK